MTHIERNFRLSNSRLARKRPQMSKLQNTTRIEIVISVVSFITPGLLYLDCLIEGPRRV